MSLVKLTLQRRPYLGADTRRSPSPPLIVNDKQVKQAPRPKVDPKVRAICDRCYNMYHLAQRENRRLSNKTLLCIRLLQIERCIRKIQEEQRSCNWISIWAFGSGVNVKQRRLNCSKMNIGTSDIDDVVVKPSKPAKGRGCRYRQPNKNLSKLMYCGMFGDPHLRTFSDERQTCVVAGAWTLIDNDHLAVQVTNEIVQSTESTSATATSKVSVNNDQPALFYTPSLVSWLKKSTSGDLGGVK